jgi:hypothetical protein
MNKCATALLWIILLNFSCYQHDDDTNIVFIESQDYSSDTVIIVDPETYDQIMIIEKKSELVDKGVVESYRDTLESGTVRVFGMYNTRIYQIYEFQIMLYREFKINSPNTAPSSTGARGVDVG